VTRYVTARTPTTLSEGAMTYKRQRASFDWLALWILLSAWSSISGWCLSAFGWLNPAGTAVSYSLFLVGLILFRSHLQRNGGRSGWKMLRSRYVLPRIWLLLVVLALLGGMAHAPNNYDYLTYRFPRVLYWTWDHGWSWIPTVNARINYSGTGFEWLMAPLFIIFKTDRFFFLINFVSCLLLPGVIFSVFYHLGISKRISWWWMWILPCGYCFILQAASAGNDSFAAVYFLASLHYLFQTRKTSSPFKNLALSCLAIALTTGAKGSNLPLVLPWLAVLFFHRRCLLERCRPAMVAVVLMAAAAVSFLPTALLNLHFTGDYAGDPNNEGKLKVSNPVIGVLGNSLQLATGNLTPPLLPRSIDWVPLLPSRLTINILHDFPRFGLDWGELQIEEEAGLGLGIVLFATVFMVVGIETRLVNPSLIVARNRRAVAVVAAGAIAGMAYMSKLGGEATARLMAPYYPILIAGILIMVSLDGRIVRRGAFIWVGLIAMLSAIPLLILSPARPLFPVQIVGGIIANKHVSAGIIARYNMVYSVYAARSDVFKELAVSIPPNEGAIGVLQGGDDPVASLWCPFGARKVIEVTPKDSIEEVKARGIHFVAVSDDALAVDHHTALTFLIAKWSGSLVAEKSIILKAHRGPERWYLLRL
jgi:hypothetical protein